MICELLDNNDFVTAYSRIQQNDYSMFSDAALEVYKRILTDNIARYDEDDISSSGYVLNTLEASFWCLSNTKSYEAAVLKAVNLGDDTDTVGAVVGSMAGILYGLEAIPHKWISKLQRSEYLLDLCDKFESVSIKT